ncbi:hypothetical protein [Halorubrum vacuolatum]|uniref:Uncharacterized protein n=1 Tax=Halorubrum vacuolatum TaxID=63740 RepID=A0A238YAE7_HALVU|nr:hypothetical protein [Halorubrum vacuolatum]SNR68236.1 hypothetical protein SAMN06264855_1364 [Halorubrum vacuolatum]
MLSETDEIIALFNDVFAGAVYEIPTRVALQPAWNAGSLIFEHNEELSDAEAEYGRLAVWRMSDVSRLS